MNLQDAEIIGAVMRHNGITENPVKRFINSEVELDRALKTYHLIYASLSYEERMAAQYFFDSSASGKTPPNSHHAVSSLTRFPCGGAH